MLFVFSLLRLLKQIQVWESLKTAFIEAVKLSLGGPAGATIKKMAADTGALVFFATYYPFQKALKKDRSTP